MIDKIKLFTDFLNWMNEINSTNPMQLETDHEDIALMYIDSGRADALVRQGASQPVQTAGSLRPKFNIGEEIRLVKNMDGIGVEDYDIGEIYRIDDYKLVEDEVYYYLHDNIHGYTKDCFEKVR